MKDCLTEDRHVDLVGDLDDDVLLPLWGVDQVADGEGDVGCVVLFVLFEDRVAPGLVEISACHVGAVELSLEDRNQLDTIYLSFSRFVSSSRLLSSSRRLRVFLILADEGPCWGVKSRQFCVSCQICVEGGVGTRTVPT